MFSRFIKAVSLTLMTAYLFGCGGGGGGTNGTLSISAPATASAGKIFQVTAKITSTSGVQAFPVSFTSSDPLVVPTGTADTDSTGVATVQLRAMNVINADKTVTITAHAGDLTSSAQVLIKANKLTFNAPAKGTISGTAGSAIEYFITGAGSLVKYTDADGAPLGGKTITIKVNTTIGSIADVIWHWNLADTSYFTANPMTFTTLSDGSLPNSIISVVANSPPSGSSSDFGVNLLVSVTDPLFGTMTIPGDIAFTITTP